MSSRYQVERREEEIVEREVGERCGGRVSRRRLGDGFCEGRLRRDIDLVMLEVMVEQMGAYLHPSDRGDRESPFRGSLNIF